MPQKTSGALCYNPPKPCLIRRTYPTTLIWRA